MTVIVVVHLPDSPLHIEFILSQQSNHSYVLIVWLDRHIAARFTIVQLSEQHVYPIIAISTAFFNSRSLCG